MLVKETIVGLLMTIGVGLVVPGVDVIAVVIGGAVIPGGGPMVTDVTGKMLGVTVYVILSAPEFVMLRL